MTAGRQKQFLEFQYRGTRIACSIDETQRYRPLKYTICVKSYFMSLPECDNLGTILPIAKIPAHAPLAQPVGQSCRADTGLLVIAIAATVVFARVMAGDGRSELAGALAKRPGRFPRHKRPDKLDPREDLRCLLRSLH